MKIIKLQPKGFNLLEVIIYIALLSFFIIIIFSLFLWANHVHTKSTIIREVVGNANRIINIITYEIKNAQDIYLPTSTTAQLSLKTTNYLPANERFSYIDFYLCDTQICFKKEFLDPVAITSDTVKITNLSFEPLATSSVPAVKINLTLEPTNYSQSSSYNFSYNLITTVSLRSY